MSRKALGSLSIAFAAQMLAYALSPSVPAFAQKSKPIQTGAPAGDVSYKSKTVYDFDDDVVEGDLVRPDGEFVDTRHQAKHSSLIKIRENFIPEMLKSAEDI